MYCSDKLSMEMNNDKFGIVVCTALCTNRMSNEAGTVGGAAFL